MTFTLPPLRRQLDTCPVRRPCAVDQDFKALLLDWPRLVSHIPRHSSRHSSSSHSKSTCRSYCKVSRLLLFRTRTCNRGLKPKSVRIPLQWSLHLAVPVLPPNALPTLVPPPHSDPLEHSSLRATTTFLRWEAVGRFRVGTRQPLTMAAPPTALVPLNTPLMGTSVVGWTQIKSRVCGAKLPNVLHWQPGRTL